MALGEAHLSIGKLDAAQDVLGQCIQFFPKHPWSYRARLLAQPVWREKGMLPEAKRVLFENLDHDSLTPESQGMDRLTIRLRSTALHGSHEP